MHFKKNKNKIFALIVVISFSLANLLAFPAILINSLNIEKNISIKHYFPKTNDQEIVIVTPENKTYSEPMSGYFPSTYGFENDFAGDYPNMWEIDDTAGTIRVIEEVGGHKKVLELEDTSDLGHIRVNQTFSIKEFGTVELWWRMNDTTKKSSIALLNSVTHNPVITLLWNGDLNDWRYAIGSSWYDVPNIPNPVANTWYRMIIDFERTTGNYQGLSQNKWKVIFNGIDSGELNLRNNEDVGKLTLITYTSHDDYSFYLDAIGYSWDPSYSLGNNKFEGLLLSFQNNTALDWMGYSLDGQATISILGNKSLPFPGDGSHTIEVYGNNSIGTIYQSDIRIFSINTINIITPEDKAYSEPMSGYFPSTYGFENDFAGDYPNMWEIDDTAGTIRVIEEVGGHKKVLELEDTSDLEHIRVDQTFPIKEFGTVELWWRMNDTTKRSSIGLLNSVTQNPVITLLWNGDLNDWRYAIGSSWYDVPNIPNPVANTWYRMIIDFERTTGNYQGLGQNKWNVNFNGVNSGQLNLRNNEDVGKLTFITYTSHDDYSFYLDAIGYSWDTAYNLGDNLFEGLLLSFQNNTALDWMGYSLDGLPTSSILGNKTLPFLADGSHTVQVFGSYSIKGLYQSRIRAFLIDTIPPTSVISFTPYSGINEVNKSTEFTISANDGLGSGVSLVRYKINNSGWIDYISSFDLSSYEYGDYMIYYYSIDVAGNVETENTLLVKLVEVSSEPSEPIIPGYLISLLLASICIVSTIIIKRKLKK